MIFFRIIRLLVKIIPEKKILFKNFSKSGGGTDRPKIKIKKMFQNMISLRIIRLVVKEISEKKFFAKNFLSLLGGGDL